MLDLWYKNAVLYCVDVETYMDGNGDGVGDFRGLSQRLDHIAGLGATCVWLLPFYATPNKDNGYDVSDYYAVDPRLGTFGDFVEFTHLAREKGLRVIVDLVVNHSSTEHPWFKAACADRNSPFRDFYLWSEEKPADAHEGMVFPGVQHTTWTWNEQAGAHYFHRFYDHEADLNMDNPAVREEIERIMGFWLQLGVSGFRIDAAPFVIETPVGADKGRMHFEYIQEMRSVQQWRRGDAVLLAEANVTPEEVGDYVGDGDGMHLMFNFITNQRLFLALARQDPKPLAEAIKSLPEMPEMAQWANFVRNHDELDLGRLSDGEREECFRLFAPEEHMRAYGRGIRRRLAPMLGNDRRRLELAYSLMFTLSGTPVIWYGEEIGMGENLDLPERTAVRTPMQWTDGPNGGFSPAPADRLVRPVNSGGDYGFEKVNAEAQARDRDSLLTWFERATKMRRQCPEFGWGPTELLDLGNPKVLAHRCRWRGNTVAALHNFSPDKQSVSLEPLCEEGTRLVDLFEDKDYGRLHQADRLDLEGYGYVWVRVEGK